MVWNRIARKITKAASKSSNEDPKKSTPIPQSASMPKQIYTTPGKQQQIINKLRLLELLI